MNEILEKILNEVQGLNKEMNLRFKEQDERIAAEFKKIYERLDKLEDRFDIQTKEISQELRTMADFIYERDKKLIRRLEEKLDEEIRYNRIVQNSYDARLSKIELYEANLEAKYYDLEKTKKVS